MRRQNDKLNSCTKDLRRKLRGAQNQMHILIDERAELTAKVNSYGHIFDYFFSKFTKRKKKIYYIETENKGNFCF